MKRAPGHRVQRRGSSVLSDGVDGHLEILFFSETCRDKSVQALAVKRLRP
jgi:hypothetical protein